MGGCCAKEPAGQPPAARPAVSGSPRRGDAQAAEGALKPDAGAQGADSGLQSLSPCEEYQEVSQQTRETVDSIRKRVAGCQSLGQVQQLQLSQEEMQFFTPLSEAPGGTSAWVDPGSFFARSGKFPESPAPDAPPPPPVQWHGPESAPRAGESAASVRVVPQQALADMTENECCEGEAVQWLLRVGPSYRATGAKKPSLPSLYAFHSLDLWRSTKGVINIAERMQLPAPGLDCCGLPGCLVLNVQVPISEHPLGKSKGTLNCVFTFRLRKPPSDLWGPAGRLLRSFAEAVPLGAAQGAKMRKREDLLGRMKLLGRAREGVPDIFSSYNGKPVLVTGSGSFHRAEHYLLCTCDLRKWNVAARGALYSLWDKLPSYQFAFGVCIEPRLDEEMDERLLGCVHLSRIAFHKAAEAPAAWQSTTPKAAP